MITKNKLFALILIIASCRLMAAPVMPIVSNSTSSTYYYISFGRQAAKCIQENGLAAALTQVTKPAIATDATNAQRWRVVEVAPNSSTYYIISKSGLCFLYDATTGGTTSGKMIGGNSADVFSFKASTNATYLNSWSLLKNGVGVNDQSGATVTLYSNEAAAGNAINFIFVETVAADASQLLIDEIVSSEVLYNSTPSGTNPGLVTTLAKTTFRQAIDAAILAKTGDDATKTAAKQTLSNAKQVFLNTPTSAFKYSTLIDSPTTIWYNLRTPGRTTTSYMKDNGAGNTISGAAFAANDETLMWKLVDAGNGKVLLVSKSSKGQLQDQTVESGFIALTTTEQPRTIVPLGSGQYNLNGTNFSAHLDAQFKLVSYNGGLNSASAWMFEEIALTAQTITFDPLNSVVVGAAPFNLSATASSNLTVSYISSNPSVASVSGNTVTILTAGTTEITAIQNGNGTFAVAPTVKRTLEVNTTTGLNAAESIRIAIHNRKIVIEGTNVKPSIYTVTGQMVDVNKMLNPGIYRVKIPGFCTRKIEIR